MLSASPHGLEFRLRLTLAVGLGLEDSRVSFSAESRVQLRARWSQSLGLHLGGGVGF